MRKTIYAILAMVGISCASAATALHSWSWSAEGAAAGNSDLITTFNYTSGNDYAVIGGGNCPSTTNITGIENDFTISFDVRNLSAANTNWNSILCLYSNDATTGNAYSLQLQFNSAGNLKLYNKINNETSFGGADTTGDPNNIDSGITSSDLVGSTEWTSFSIVSDLTNKELSLYVNGNLAGSITNWAPASPELTGLRFAKSLSGEHALSGTLEINNINFYNEVVIPSPATPEPATASLSLLGLAALMMRRRRA